MLDDRVPQGTVVSRSQAWRVGLGSTPCLCCCRCYPTFINVCPARKGLAAGVVNPERLGRSWQSPVSENRTELSGLASALQPSPALSPGTPSPVRLACAGAPCFMYRIGDPTFPTWWVYWLC